MSLKVSNDVTIYEVDGKDEYKKVLQVSSSEHHHSFVVLKTDGGSITVKGVDLKRAIENAVNV